MCLLNGGVKVSLVIDSANSDCSCAVNGVPTYLLYMQVNSDFMVVKMYWLLVILPPTYILLAATIISK